MRTSPIARLLLIDDDDLSREVLSVLLESEGCAVRSAASGEAALLMLAADGAAVSESVLCDLNMPGVHGPELATRLRADLPQTCRLIAMSGSVPGSLQLQGYDAFLEKPFTIDELATALMSPAATVSSQSPAPPPSPSVLDMATLAQFEAMLRQPQIRELYAMCLNDATTHLQMMGHAVSVGGDAEFRQHAHAMKGSFAMVGAIELRTLCSGLEEQGLGLPDAHASLAEISSAAERLQQMLESCGYQIAAGSIGETRA